MDLTANIDPMESRLAFFQVFATELHRHVSQGTAQDLADEKALHAAYLEMVNYLLKMGVRFETRVFPIDMETLLKEYETCLKEFRTYSNIEAKFLAAYHAVMRRIRPFSVFHEDLKEMIFPQDQILLQEIETSAAQGILTFPYLDSLENIHRYYQVLHGRENGNDFYMVDHHHPDRMYLAHPELGSVVVGWSGQALVVQDRQNIQHRIYPQRIPRVIPDPPPRPARTQPNNRVVKQYSKRKKSVSETATTQVPVSATQTTPSGTIVSVVVPPTSQPPPASQQPQQSHPPSKSHPPPALKQSQGYSILTDLSFKNPVANNIVPKYNNKTPKSNQQVPLASYQAPIVSSRSSTYLSPNLSSHSSTRQDYNPLDLLAEVATRKTPIVSSQSSTHQAPILSSQSSTHQAPIVSSQSSTHQAPIVSSQSSTHQAPIVSSQISTHQPPIVPSQSSTRQAQKRTSHGQIISNLNSLTKQRLAQKNLQKRPSEAVIELPAEEAIRICQIHGETTANISTQQGPVRLVIRQADQPYVISTQNTTQQNPVKSSSQSIPSSPSSSQPKLSNSHSSTPPIVSTSQSSTPPIRAFSQSSITIPIDVNSQQGTRDITFSHEDMLNILTAFFIAYIETLKENNSKQGGEKRGEKSSKTEALVSAYQALVTELAARGLPVNPNQPVPRVDMLYTDVFRERRLFENSGIQMPLSERVAQVSVCMNRAFGAYNIRLNGPTVSRAHKIALHKINEKPRVEHFFQAWTRASKTYIKHKHRLAKTLLSLYNWMLEQYKYADVSFSEEESLCIDEEILNEYNRLLDSLSGSGLEEDQIMGRCLYNSVINMVNRTLEGNIGPRFPEGTKRMFRAGDDVIDEAFQKQNAIFQRERARFMYGPRPQQGYDVTPQQQQILQDRFDKYMNLRMMECKGISDKLGVPEPMVKKFFESKRNEMKIKLTPEQYKKKLIEQKNNTIKSFLADQEFQDILNDYRRNQEVLESQPSQSTSSTSQPASSSSSLYRIIPTNILAPQTQYPASSTIQKFAQAATQIQYPASSTIQQFAQAAAQSGERAAQQVNQGAGQGAQPSQSSSGTATSQSASSTATSQSASSTSLSASRQNRKRKRGGKGDEEV